MIVEMQSIVLRSILYYWEKVRGKLILVLGHDVGLEYTASLPSRGLLAKTLFRFCLLSTSLW